MRATCVKSGEGHSKEITLKPNTEIWEGTGRSYRKKGKEHSKDREQHIHKGSEHDTTYNPPPKKNASEKGMGRLAGPTHTKPLGHNEDFVD